MAFAEELLASLPAAATALRSILSFLPIMAAADACQPDFFTARPPPGVAGAEGVALLVLVDGPKDEERRTLGSPTPGLALMGRCTRVPMLGASASSEQATAMRGPLPWALLGLLGRRAP